MGQHGRGKEPSAKCLEENGSWELSHCKVPDSESFGKYATAPDQQPVYHTSPNCKIFRQM
jgi:hypothetical protein